MKFSHEAGQSIEIDGAAIYYEVIGDDAAPPLLFLHGGAGTIEDFNPILPSLASQYRVIGIDSRGHGRSTLGESRLTYLRLERDVVEVLQHLRIERTAIVGFSDGGIVGYRLMASRVIALSGLITIGASYQLKEGDPVRDIYAKVTGESWRAKFPGSYELYRRLNPEPDFDRFMAALVDMWLDTAPSGYPGDRIDDIKGDVLVIRGDEDHLFPTQDAVDLVSRVKSSALENVAFAGHAVLEDRPQAVQDCIGIFLKRTYSS